MGFFKSLRGCHPDTIGGPSSQGTMQNISNNKEDNNAHSTEAPCHPSPDPPSSQHSQYQAPQGPPLRNSGYAPPPGPPPSHQNYEHNSTPNISSQEPPPYHDWTIIPDTALLPPPPSVGYETGIASNADPCEADRARDWCRMNPLIFSHQPTLAQIAAVRSGNVQLMRPKEYRGELFTPRTGVWQGITRAGSSDSCILTSSPLYFAHADSPTRTGQPKTIYFELEVTSLGCGSKTDVCSIAIGYCALPYPTWRMPGWERASLAVHSDVSIPSQADLRPSNNLFLRKWALTRICATRMGIVLSMTILADVRSPHHSELMILLALACPSRSPKILLNIISSLEHLFSRIRLRSSSPEMAKRRVDGIFTKS